ncbi:ion-translocating oxidoreductase complex subunit C-like isoform X2 [Bolinopsis microptera]|uniref:ion-translocating oxidoreductase complex subunit C-like isoform X2 n=1 Tax=Bolinopsis microptera TaxID=2820187 RepID=UPI003079D51C
MGNTAELERQVNKLRVGCELNKQEADRVKVELAAAQRKMTDELKKHKDTIDAKDIELRNWYDEKEKAVKMISNKKEKEISALEKLLEDKDMLIKNLEQNTVATVAVDCLSPAMGSEEYIRLSEESKRKLTEMADMVIQMETDRDETRAEFEKFKSQIDEAISEKETKFAELRAELASTEKRNKEQQETVSTALARSIELEQNVSELKREMECMETKRSKQVSAELDEGGRESTQSSRSSNRISNKPSSRTSALNHSRRSSGQRRSGSNVGGSRTSGKRPVVKTASRRTSQVLINKTLNTNRSKKSRIQPIEESPSSDNFATPGSVGVKRKATLKGLKDLLTGSSPRQSKRGKAAPISVSESDSDFATPSQPEPKRGKRKLHKSQISTPELIPPPERPGLRDVVPDTPDTDTKITRSRTKLIQEHLSGKNLRKTRSRATRI